MKSTLNTRPAFLGEASLIAGVTACAYLMALAYRAGQMTRYGLPITLASVSLSDAAFAGLIVLLVGVTGFVLVDYVESRAPGATARVLAAILVGTFFLLLALVEMMILLLFLRFASSMEPWIPLAGMVVAAPAVYWVWTRILAVALAANPRLDATEALTRRSPVAVFAVAAAFLVCAVALIYGWAGVVLPGQPMLVSRSTCEVALAVSEQRAVLAGVESTSSSDATLTGAVRVVPLPSNEISFTTSRIVRIHAAPD